jgi:hypothetical protein
MRNARDAGGALSLLLLLALAGCAGSQIAGRCSGADDCAAGQACHEGVCRDICVDSFSCPAGFLCSEGVCQPGPGSSDGRPLVPDGGDDRGTPGDEAPGDETPADGGDSAVTDPGGDESGDSMATDPGQCVASWTPTYAGVWTCTAAGASGCYQDPSGYLPATFSATCPDAPYPAPAPRIFTDGYVASYTTGDYDTCSASCGGGTQCRTVTAATFKADAPSVSAPEACRDCNTQDCPQPCHCEDLINTTSTWYSPGTLLCDGIVDNDSQPADECIQKYKAGITNATCPSGTIDDLINTTCCKC